MIVRPTPQDLPFVVTRWVSAKGGPVTFIAPFGETLTLAAVPGVIGTVHFVRIVDGPDDLTVLDRGPIPRGVVAEASPFALTSAAPAKESEGEETEPGHEDDVDDTNEEIASGETYSGDIVSDIDRMLGDAS